MAPNGLTIFFGVGSLLLGFLSVVLAVGSSLAVGVLLGLILGVALSPWIRKAAIELAKYLSR
jgi:hypothetical protein